MTRSLESRLARLERGRPGAEDKLADLAFLQRAFEDWAACLVIMLPMDTLWYRSRWAAARAEADRQLSAWEDRTGRDRGELADQCIGGKVYAGGNYDAGLWDPEAI